MLERLAALFGLRRCPAVNTTAGPHPRRCDKEAGPHPFHLSDQGHDQLIWAERTVSIWETSAAAQRHLESELFSTTPKDAPFRRLIGLDPATPDAQPIIFDDLEGPTPDDYQRRRMSEWAQRHLVTGLQDSNQENPPTV